MVGVVGLLVILCAVNAQEDGRRRLDEECEGGEEVHLRIGLDDTQGFIRTSLSWVFEPWGGATSVGEGSFDIDAGEVAPLPGMCVMEGNYALEFRRPGGNCENRVFLEECSVPTGMPTPVPTLTPTLEPTAFPTTAAPSRVPSTTDKPSFRPTRAPTPTTSTATPSGTPTPMCHADVIVERGTCTSRGCSVLNFFDLDPFRATASCSMEYALLSVFFGGDISSSSEDAVVEVTLTNGDNDGVAIGGCTGAELESSQPEACLGELSSCAATTDVDVSSFLEPTGEVFDPRQLIVEGNGNANVDSCDEHASEEPAFRMEAQLSYSVCCLSPSSFPTFSPSPQPTAKPTPTPTPAPSPRPSDGPTSTPTTATPTARPTWAPTTTPGAPTPKPTATPSLAPSPKPSALTAAPVSYPPTVRKTPTPKPSIAPTVYGPTRRPSVQGSPTSKPTSAQPTAKPSGEPSPLPSSRPSEVPTPQPSAFPTNPTPVPTSSCSLFERTQESMCDSEGCEIANTYSIPLWDAERCFVTQASLTVTIRGDFNGDLQADVDGVEAREQVLLTLDGALYTAGGVCSSGEECSSDFDDCSGAFSAIDVTSAFGDGSLSVLTRGVRDGECPSFYRASVAADYCCVQPSSTPTLAPTTTPTQPPFAVPSLLPTWKPTRLPTLAPTDAPTSVPTSAPTDACVDTFCIHVRDGQCSPCSSSSSKKKKSALVKWKTKKVKFNEWIYVLWAFLALVGLCCCCGVFYKLCFLYGDFRSERDGNHAFLPDNRHPSYVDAKMSAWRKKKVAVLPFGYDDDDDDDDGEYKQQRTRRAVSFVENRGGQLSPLRRRDDDEEPPRFNRRVDRGGQLSPLRRRDHDEEPPRFNRRSLLARSQLDNPLPPMPPGYSPRAYPPRAREDDDDSTVFARPYSPRERDDDAYYHDSSRRRPPGYGNYQEEEEERDHRISTAPRPGYFQGGGDDDILTESRAPVPRGRGDHDGDILVGGRSPTRSSNRHVNTGRSELWAGLIGS